MLQSHRGCEHANTWEYLIVDVRGYSLGKKYLYQPPHYEQLRIDTNALLLDTNTLLIDMNTMRITANSGALYVKFVNGYISSF